MWALASDDNRALEDAPADLQGTASEFHQAIIVTEPVNLGRRAPVWEALSNSFNE
jgi:hypothetical protein